MDDDFKPMFKKDDIEKSTFDDWVVKDESVKLEERRVEKKVELISADDLETIKKQAYDEAYQAGLAQGQSEVENQKQQLQELVNLILRPLSLVEQEVQKELINLCAWLTKILLNAELNYDPQKILNIFNDLKELLPSTKVVKTLYLNPEDHQVVIDSFEKEQVDFPIDLIQIEQNFTRGEYRLETIESEVDATVEARLQELVLNTLTQQDVNYE